MAPNPAIMKSVEQLGYRVTVGDVAAQAGLEINFAQQGLLALASDAGGHLQVADTGEIVYLFPKHFRTTLRNKFWRLRLKEWWEKIWKVLFYLIRISFGIVLVISILLIMIAIIVIFIAMSASRDSDNNSNGGGRQSSDGGGISFFPYFWSFNIFDPDYNSNRYQYSTSRGSESKKQMNFLEAIFSFLFGDGNPNLDLEERRWQEIGSIIRSNNGAVIAQQIAPFLDNIDAGNSENEDYMIPVLARFNGYPEVSPEGDIIYYFPELQVTAQKHRIEAVSEYLRERLWRFSEAGSGQIILAIALGSANFILALVLGSLLRGNIAAQLGGFVAFANSIYWFLLGYGTAFLAVPLIRYFWIQWRNSKIKRRNQQRQSCADFLSSAAQILSNKIAYARRFATEKVITDKDITYSTETDLLEQESQRSDQIDEEWRRRLESG